MQIIQPAAFAAAIMLGGAQQSYANILEVDFAGIAYGAFGSPLTGLVWHSDSYTAQFVFDTSRGTTESPAPGVFQVFGNGPQSPWIDGNVLIGGWNYAVANDGPDSVARSELHWHIASDVLIVDSAIVTFTSDLLRHYEYDSSRRGDPGFFQAGVCPPNCGSLSVTSASITDITPAVHSPGPMSGGGLPGIILAGIVLLGWWIKPALKHRS
jgi:hypothetical protein